MLRGMAADQDDRDFAQAFEKRVADRQLVKTLAVIRARAGLSQQEMAAKIGCGQPKVSKLESGVDTEVRFGDLLAYLRASEHEMRLYLVPKGKTLADEVKMHTMAIKGLLDRMVHLAGTDDKIAKGVADFLEEAAANLIRLTRLTAEALPPGVRESCALVRVEAPDGNGRSEQGSDPETKEEERKSESRPSRRTSTSKAKAAAV